MSQEEANEIVRETQRLRRTRRALKLGLPTAAALGAGAVIAVAAIPGSGGVITGCYAVPNPTLNSDGVANNATINGAVVPPGTLRVIDPSLPKTIANPFGQQVPNPAAACDEKEEKTITWNEKGPQGPPGATGPQGTPGPAGAAGGQGGPGTPGTPLLGGTTFGISGSGETFLKLDGIKGESSEKDHKDEIQVESFSFGAAQGGSQSSGGGGGAGKVTISSFTITKTVDKSSPLLFQASATGQHIKNAEVSFARKAGGTQKTYLKLDLQNVLISGIQLGASDKQVPTEQITFAFQKCVETFVEPNGRVGASVNVNVGNTLKL